VYQRTATLDSDRGSDVTGSEVHEGRRQTVRCDELVVDGKAPSDISALKPYWGKPAVRDFRGSGGNVGIMRSPVRATALPGNASVGTTLGAVALGRKAGRFSDVEITVYKAMGVAMEDMVAANLAYQRAKREGGGGMMAW